MNRAEGHLPEEMQSPENIHYLDTSTYRRYYSLEFGYNIYFKYLSSFSILNSVYIKLYYIFYIYCRHKPALSHENSA
jgi:hypothetical protein